MKIFATSITEFHLVVPRFLPHWMSGLAELESNFATYLARLHFLLDPGNLPDNLPLHDKAAESIYGAFLHFTIDPNILEKTGNEVGAFSEQFKAIFGWKTRSTGDGIIPIKERGRPLSAAVDVLSRFHKKHPNDAVIQKWGFDIGKGVEKVYQIHGHKVRHFSDSDGDESDKDEDSFENCDSVTMPHHQEPNRSQDIPLHLLAPDSDANLLSPALLDMLSDMPLVGGMETTLKGDDMSAGPDFMSDSSDDLEKAFATRIASAKGLTVVDSDTH